MAPSYIPFEAFGNCFPNQPSDVRGNGHTEWAAAPVPAPPPASATRSAGRSAEPVVHMNGSGNNAAEERGGLYLVRALGEIILRAQEAQVERILEQGKRLEDALKHQQCTLAVLQKQVGTRPVMQSWQSTLSREGDPQLTVNSKLEPKPCCEDDFQKSQQISEAPVPKFEPKPLCKPAIARSWSADFSRSTLFQRHLETPVTDGVVDGKDGVRVESVIVKVLGKQQETGNVPNRCGAHFLMSNGFGFLCGVMIFFNAILILLQTDYSARNPSGQTPSIYLSGETVFFVFFAMELALRIWVGRSDFFTGDEWRWHYLDVVIVLAAACEEVVKYMEQGSTVAKKATFLRVMRILKIGRITRMFRVVRLFKYLRIMVTSIVATMMTLFWSIVCLVMIMITFATFFLTVVSDHQSTNGPHPELDPFFGSMTAMIISLFQITTGGFDWREMSSLLMEFSPLSVAVLCLYVSMMEYAILNILTGICCTTANKTTEDDMDITMHEEQQRQDCATAKLRKYFHLHDTSGNGEITWKQLDRYLNDPLVRSSFKRLDLERWHLQSFFDMIDTNDDGEASINIDHFIRGCTRLRCNVKNIDLVASGYEGQQVCKKQYLELLRKVDAMHHFLMFPPCHPGTDVTADTLM